MASSNSFVSVIKILALLVLVLAIAIPIRYGSTNPKYLRIRFFHSLFSMKYSFTPDTTRPTLSADYRAFESLFHHKPILQIDRALNPLEMVKKTRATFELGNAIPHSSQCQTNKQVYEYEGHTVDAHWIKNHDGKEETSTQRIILYFHGGAYMLGDFEAYSGFECHLSRIFNVSILHLEYRRAPEHPLPAAVDDAVTLYRALLRDGVASSRLAIMGDSAGGGLTLLTIQALLARHLPIPRVAITLSPWTDLTLSGKSYTRNRLTDVMIRADSLAWGVEQVFGPHHVQVARDDPSYSPLFGSFKEFPPTYITVGTAEVLEDDSRQLADKLRREGVDVTLEIGQHLMHVHPIFFEYYPEATDTLDNIRQWLEPRFQ